MQNSAGRTKTIIVEDSRRMQEILADSVRELPGLQLMAVAESAEEALASFELHHPDLVTLDLVLKGSNGLEVLHEIKRLEPGCRVLVFTAYDDDQYRARSLAAGAYRFFSKAKQHAELIQTLREIGGGPRPTKDEEPPD
jgi:DNA-binding NarL/FixJ family response regulator